MIDIRQEPDAVLLPVKVVAGASRTRLLGELGGRAKIAVASPAEGGRANRALIAFLAQQLGMPRRALAISSGTTSPVKTIRINGAEADQVRRALGLQPT